MNKYSFFNYLRADLKYMLIFFTRVIGSRNSVKNHPFHLVDSSFLPITFSFVIFFNLFYLIQSFSKQVFFSFHFTLYSFAMLVILFWLFNAAQEEKNGHHTTEVQYGFKLGIILFIVSEIMLFFSFFWSYFQFSLNPSIHLGELWPPEGLSPLTWYRIPLLNTIILLSSGLTITVAHQLSIWGDTIYKYYYWKWLLTYLIILTEYNVLFFFKYQKNFNILEKILLPIGVVHWLQFQETTNTKSWGEYFGLHILNVKTFQKLTFQNLELICFDEDKKLKQKINIKSLYNNFYLKYQTFYELYQASYCFYLNYYQDVWARYVTPYNTFLWSQYGIRNAALYYFLVFTLKPVHCGNNSTVGQELDSVLFSNIFSYDKYYYLFYPSTVQSYIVRFLALNPNKPDIYKKTLFFNNINVRFVEWVFSRVHWFRAYKKFFFPNWRIVRSFQFTFKFNNKLLSLLYLENILNNFSNKSEKESFKNFFKAKFSNNFLEPDRFKAYIKPNNYILYTVFLGIFFLLCQIFEYNIALFTLQDSAYGTVFYMLTGLHGFHVYVGMTALFGCYISRLDSPNKFYEHRITFDGSIWYWHFVDVVWLLVFIIVYWWGGIAL